MTDTPDTEYSAALALTADKERELKAMQKAYMTAEVDYYRFRAEEQWEAVRGAAQRAGLPDGDTGAWTRVGSVANGSIQGR